jgi:hypothetical protein
VALALVLLSAALVVLAGIPADPGGPPDGDAADETAEVIATSTATVEYTLSPGARKTDRSFARFPTTEGPEFERTAHGTLAGLLGRAAVGNVTVDGTEVTRADDDFQRGVANATAPAIDAAGTGVQVQALWRPYPGAPIRGRMVVGDAPPPTADVHAATLTVPSGMDPARKRAIRAADRRGFDGVANVIAGATVRGLYPPEELALAMRAEHPVAPLERYRYRNAGWLLGVDLDPDPDPSRDEIRRGNRKLTETLADRMERDLRGRYETPGAAARDVSVGTVEITVRTWSR